MECATATAARLAPSWRLFAGRDADLARELGAGQVLEREGGLVARRWLEGLVDGVFDTAGVGASIAVVRDGGRFVSTVTGVLPHPERGIVPEAFTVAENGADLARASRLVDEGVLTLRVARDLPFDGVQEAHRLLALGGSRGKILLHP